jgi:hypothetical protein
MALRWESVRRASYSDVTERGEALHRRANSFAEAERGVLKTRDQLERWPGSGLALRCESISEWYGLNSFIGETHQIKSCVCGFERSRKCTWLYISRLERNVHVPLWYVELGLIGRLRNV